MSDEDVTSTPLPITVPEDQALSDQETTTSPVPALRESISVPTSHEIKVEEVRDLPQRSASADLPEKEDKSLHPPPPKDRSNSHCFGSSPISALLNKLRRQSSYDVRQTDLATEPTSAADNLSTSQQDGMMSRAARRSIHGISSAFASLRGKKEEEVIHVFNFVSPTLFLYGKDLKQAASKKLAEWDKIEAARSKEEKELRETVTRHFIVDCSAFIFLDNAGAASMVQTYREMSARNIRVYYAAARESVRGFFLDLDETDRVPPSAFYPTVDCASQVAKAYRDSPPHISISSLPDDGPLEEVEEDGKHEEDGEGRNEEEEKNEEDKKNLALDSEEEETVSRH